MARFLAYAYPGSGHLYPLMETAIELRDRGHEVVVRADRDGVETLSRAGFDARPIGREVEDVEDETWRARTPLGSMRRHAAMYVERFEHEVRDLREAVAAERPDVVMVDNNCWGATAAAETSGLPWAQLATFLLPIMTPDAPPFGLGLRPAAGPLGRLRDAAIRAGGLPLFDRDLPRVNEARRRAGARPVSHIPDLYMLAPLVVAYTAEPLEYPGRDLPAAVELVGPASWDPSADGATPAWLEQVDRPLVLVACSSQFQNDARLIETALRALADEPVAVVATTAALDPARFDVPANARLERFVPHSVVLPRTACVVCHGGMGVTQKALLHGVPVCVVPFGRDQFETARRVEVAGAGSRLSPFRLNPRRLRRALRVALERRDGAVRAGASLKAAGGGRAAAQALERLAARAPTRRPPAAA